MIDGVDGDDSSVAGDDGTEDNGFHDDDSCDDKDDGDGERDCEGDP